MVQTLTVQTPGRGLLEITHQIERVVSLSGVTEGLCTIFLMHTSAGLIIQENADPTAQRDLEAWLDRHVPDGDPRHLHSSEGPDDMPAHIRSVLTGVHLAIPILGRELSLGTWQGIYLWEHRSAPHARRLAVHIAP